MSKSVLMADAIFHLQEIFERKPGYRKIVSSSLEDQKHDGRLASETAWHQWTWQETATYYISGKEFDIYFNSRTEWRSSRQFGLAGVVTSRLTKTSIGSDFTLALPDSWLLRNVKAKFQDVHYLLNGTVRQGINYTLQLAPLYQQQKNQDL